MNRPHTAGPSASPQATLLSTAAAQVDELLIQVGRPVAIVVAAPTGFGSGSCANSATEKGFDPLRLHELSATSATGDRSDSAQGVGYTLTALAPVLRPAEGEQLARQLSQHYPGQLIAVATSTVDDTGDSLVSNAVATFHDAATMAQTGVTVCLDEARCWRLA